jgi:hypothetical protein
MRTSAARSRRRSIASAKIDFRSSAIPKGFHPSAKGAERHRQREALPQGMRLWRISSLVTILRLWRISSLVTILRGGARQRLLGTSYILCQK